MFPYYTSAFQVRFQRPGESIYHCGIALYDYIIDARDGKVFSTKEIIEDKAPNSEDAIIEWADWRDLSSGF